MPPLLYADSPEDSESCRNYVYLHGNCIFKITIMVCSLKSIRFSSCVSELCSSMSLSMYGLRLFIAKTILFTELFTCFYDRLLSLHQVSLLYSFWFLNVLPEAVH